MLVLVHPHRYVLSFFSWRAIDVSQRTLSGRSLQILEASKTKIWAKCLPCRVRSRKEELSGNDVQDDYTWGRFHEKSQT